MIDNVCIRADKVSGYLSKNMSVCGCCYYVYYHNGNDECPICRNVENPLELKSETEFKETELVTELPLKEDVEAALVVSNNKIGKAAKFLNTSTISIRLAIHNYQLS